MRVKHIHSREKMRKSWDTLHMKITLILLALLLSASGQCADTTVDIIVPNAPPDPWQAALMARYIIHSSDWVAIATISTQDSIKGYPFVGLKSLSDGPKNNSTGVPFLYMTDVDVSGRDILANNNVTIMATLAESNYCSNEHLDPQDPRCAKVLMSGTLVKIDKSSHQYKFGEKSLFDRHPSMKTWPKDHAFYVAKVNLQQIEVLDYFGGMKLVSIEDYFNANITKLINLDKPFDSLSVLDIEVI